MYSLKPSSSRALITCSEAMVFLDSFSAISFDWVERIMMNSMQHSIRASRVSLENVRSEGMISDTIF